VDVFEAGDSGGRKTNLKLGVLDGLLREGRVRNAQGDNQQCKRANVHRDIASRKSPATAWRRFAKVSHGDEGCQTRGTGYNIRFQARCTKYFG
jgi:hypothetical protein